MIDTGLEDVYCQQPNETMKTVAPIIPLLTVVILTCSLFLFHSAVSEPPPLRRWDGQGINSIMDPIQTSVTQQQSDPIQGASSNLHFDERYDEYDMYNYNNYLHLWIELLISTIKNWHKYKVSV